MVGLCRPDVDLHRTRLTVNRQVVSVEYQLIETDVKTDTIENPPNEKTPDQSNALTWGFVVAGVGFEPTTFGL